MKEEDALKVLDSDAFVGRIVRLASVAEARLDILLSVHFAGESGYIEFIDLVATRLGFSAKIEVFSKITLGKEGKSLATLLRILRGLSYLRNRVAHDYYISGRKLTKITDNADAMVFVTADRKKRGMLKSRMEVCFNHVFNAVDKKNLQKAQQAVAADRAKARSG